MQNPQQNQNNYRKKPIKKPDNLRGCESCEYKGSDFLKDTVYPDIIRVYCKARHIEVDAESMSKDCDFWKISSSYVRSDQQENKYGL
jgi:hypothetical protein